MKKSTLSVLLIAILIVCSSQKYKEAVTGSYAVMENIPHVIGENSKLAACSMHNEVAGKENIKCTKCLMPLNGIAQKTSQIGNKSK